jgi:hypothetical protein
MNEQIRLLQLKGVAEALALKRSMQPNAKEKADMKLVIAQEKLF